MDQKRKLRGIADLYAVDDAKKAQSTEGTPVTRDTPVTGVPSLATSDAISNYSVPEETDTGEPGLISKVSDEAFDNYKFRKADSSTTGVTPVTPVTRGTEGTPVIDTLKFSKDAAPQRDFTRVANSIVREAVPAGVFTGKGKQLYDYLYSQSRGAIVPSHSVRLPSDKVMAGAGMSRKTLRFHLEKLRYEGLIEVEEVPGTHGGNKYTVNLPEEVKAKRGNPGTPGNHRNPRYMGENLPGVPGLESNPGTPGISHAKSDTYITSKTSFKTIDESDDETHTLMKFVLILEHAAKDVCMSEISYSEKEESRWLELAEVLAKELRAAGRKAGSVSSAPAFFAAHLRRTFARQRQNDPNSVVKSHLSEQTGGNAQHEDAGKTGPKRRKVEVHGREEGKSRFSFEERKRYAQNQRPPLGGGWLAESASGKFDELIEDWLGEQQAKANRPEEGGQEKTTLKRLTSEEIEERGLIIKELIEGGYTFEQAERQFGSGIHADDWREVVAKINADTAKKVGGEGEELKG